MLAYGTVSDPVVATALAVGAAALVLSVLLLVWIVAIRMWLLRKTRRYARAVDQWRPRLAAAIAGQAGEVPLLPWSEAIAFLNLWNHLHESVRGDAKAQLNAVAYRARADGFMRQLAHKKRFRDVLLGVVSLGHLRDETAWPVALQWIHSRNPVLSLAAARALVQIDAAQALPLLMPLIIEREDWTSAKVATILREAGNDIFAEPLVRSVLSVSPAQAPRLIRFLSILSPESISGTVRQLLVRTDDAHVISTCLQVLCHPDDLDLVRGFVGHPRWHVRVQAASALGRLGGSLDAESLVGLLGDEQWWVRYRAAQALASLPGRPLSRMETLMHSHPDRYARDILRQVLAEHAGRAA